jgi:hypothetical protein
MGSFRILLVVIFIGVFGYTAMVGVNHGWNLLPVLFGGMKVLAPYLLLASVKADGDVKELLLGRVRAHS